jgi:hypothetical protein
MQKRERGCRGDCMIKYFKLSGRIFINVKIISQENGTGKHTAGITASNTVSLNVTPHHG